MLRMWITPNQSFRTLPIPGLQSHKFWILRIFQKVRFKYWNSTFISFSYWPFTRCNYFSISTFKCISWKSNQINPRLWHEILKMMNRIRFLCQLQFTHVFITDVCKGDMRNDMLVLVYWISINLVEFAASKSMIWYVHFPIMVSVSQLYTYIFWIDRALYLL